MPSAEHTPGPWFVGAQNDGLYIIDGQPSPAPYDGPIPREHGPNVVARPNFALAGYEANAKLIAAAPEMLAALKFYAEYFDDEALGDAARGAIAKAEGR